MRKSSLTTILSIFAVLTFLTLFFAVPAFASDSMRHDGRRVERWDSVADVISLFGEPLLKMDLGEVEKGGRTCKVELWVYEFFPWRYELKIRAGRVWDLHKIRLRRVR